MSLTNQKKNKVSVSSLLSQYEKLFSRTKEEPDQQENQTEIKADKEEEMRLLPETKHENSIIALNNKDNPQISIFDAYAFNEVLRRYENSIVHMTKQECLLKDQEEIVTEYEQKIHTIKNQYQSQLSDYDEVKEKENNLREIIDQVNIVLDEKDQQLVEYKNEITQKEMELNKIKRELEQKELSVKNMENQLYSVLFKVTEKGALV